MLLLEFLKRAHTYVQTIEKSAKDTLLSLATLLDQETREDVKYLAGRLVQLLLSNGLDLHEPTHKHILLY